MFDSKYSADFKKSFAEQSSIIGRMATTIFVRWGSRGPFNPSVISAKLHCCLESVSWDSSERGAFVIHFSTRIFQNNWLLVESCHHEPSFKICYSSEFCDHGGILWKNIILACAALKNVIFTVISQERILLEYNIDNSTALDREFSSVFLSTTQLLNYGILHNWQV